MKIHALLADDILPLARLMADSPLWQRYNVTEAGAAQRLSEGFARNASILVAEWEGRPVGFIWFIERGAFQRSGYIMLIGVQPELSNRGVGRALMARAEASLFADADDIFLLVSDFNHAAQAFYRRLGYQPVGSLPDYVAAGITEWIFHKRKTDE